MNRALRWTAWVVTVVVVLAVVFLVYANIVMQGTRSAALQVWRGRLRERKQLRWRQDMRARMKAVRDGHDRALVRGAYAQWRQAFRLRLAEQQYYRGLATRVFKRWRSRLVQMDQIEDRGDQLVALREKRQLARFWDLWKKEVAVRKAEGVMTESVGLRILATAFDAWKKRL